MPCWDLLQYAHHQIPLLYWSINACFSCMGLPLQNANINLNMNHFESVAS